MIKSKNGKYDAVDMMINQCLTTPRFSGRATPREDLTPEDVVNWVEDNSEENFMLSSDGVCSVLDTGPHHLLENFAIMALDYRTGPLAHPWCEPRGRDFPDLEDVSGEIPWRTMHNG